MSKKTIKVAAPSKGFDFYSVISDIHDIHAHWPTIDIMCKAAERFPKSKRNLILNGDILDLPEIMSKNLSKLSHKTISGNMESVYLPAIEMAWEWGNYFLDKMQKTYNNIIWIDGNHDWRAYDFMVKYSPKAYKQSFDLRHNLKLDSRGIKHIRYNHWLDIGKCSFTHGMYHGTTALKKHLDASGQSVVFGHIHQVSSTSKITRGDTQIAWSLPCASTLNPDYIKDSENNWSNGFGELFVRPKGYFNFYICSVWNDELVHPNGRVYRS